MTRFKHPQEVLDLLGSGTALADLFLQVRINGDVALLKGIMKAVLGCGRATARRRFSITTSSLDYTTGFDEFRSRTEQGELGRHRRAERSFTRAD